MKITVVKKKKKREICGQLIVLLLFMKVKMIRLSNKILSMKKFVCVCIGGWGGGGPNIRMGWDQRH